MNEHQLKKFKGDWVASKGVREVLTKTLIKRRESVLEELVSKKPSDSYDIDMSSLAAEARMIQKLISLLSD